jgi:phosphohistidine phosphatase
MEFYLVQHGEAYSEQEDPDRSLTPAGARQIQLSAQALRKLGVGVDLVVTSTKKRAQQTAQLMAAELGYRVEEVQVTEALNPTSPVEEFIDFMRAFQDRPRVLVAGHLPSLGLIASRLLCEGRPIAIHFEMGGVGRIDVAEWPTGSGDFRWYLVPHQLALLAKGQGR